MKERPILFKSEMVQAILHGRKTQTRRVMKVQPPSEGYRLAHIACTTGDKSKIGKHHWVKTEGINIIESDENYFVSPFGYAGDELWVRETWADVNSEEGPSIMYRADGDVISWQDFSSEFGPDYGAGLSMNYEKYPGSYTMWWSDLMNGEDGHSWKPSIHMPRWASRIQLLIKDVRVERVQNITPNDCRSEGVRSIARSEMSYLKNFQKLWNGINEKRGFGWAANPWVWVVEFENLNDNEDNG